MTRMPSRRRPQGAPALAHRGPHRPSTGPRAAGRGTAGVPSLVLLAAGLGLAPALVSAQAPDFTACLARLRTTAEQSGVSAATVDAVIADVEQLPRVIESDRNQPEFVETFASYLGRRVTDERVATGRELLRRHAELLTSVAAEYGVPPQYIVAFWGLETNYGRVLGDVPVFDSLATLACDGRRGRYFTTEFVNALQIADRGSVEAAGMLGSWAGAMGHTQFMPSVYLEHAVDGDGDGRVDLWNSVGDAFASAASFLRGLGWKPGWRWGREVSLPGDFDYYRVGRDRPLPLAEWRRLGVTTADGRPLEPRSEPAALLLPAGHRGPAFLVYGNFDAIMRWNRSEFFALTVGHLADRLAGGGSLRTPPPDVPRLTRDDIEAVQRKLIALGFDVGEPDGIVGSATRSAVREWQRGNGLIADGHVDVELLQRLNLLD